MLVGQTQEEAFRALIDEIITKEYDHLVNCAEIFLAEHGGRHISISGRAEDIVQEAFALAWVKREEFLNCPEPVGWMFKAVYHKVLEALREDRTWRKHSTQMVDSFRKANNSTRSLESLKEIISERDYSLLWKLHVEGYSYKDMSEELGEKISTLAMRARRAKAAIRKKYKSLENFLKNG